MTSNNNVVVTGIGVVSPIGIGRAPFWEALDQRRSGIRILPALADLDLPVRIGAPVLDFQPRQYVTPRKALKVMSREIQLGFSAATLAVDDASLAVDQVNPDRFGVVYGSEMLYCEPQEMLPAYEKCMVNGEFDFSKWGDASMSQMYPLWMLMYLPNMTACHIGISHDARGPNNTICLGDASGLLALVEAAHIIQRGRADVMLAGATSSRISTTPMVYRGTANLSHRNDSPSEASRPFDADRDGLVNGEGAGAVVLESEEHARQRGAQVLVRLTGWDVRYGSLEVPNRHEDAIFHSVRGALRRANVSAKDIHHANAHAVGTIDGDVIEARALQRALPNIPVTAPKSYFGHLGPAGSVVELIVSILALVEGKVPVTLNYQTPDPRCPVRVIHDQPRAVDRSCAITLSQSSMGQAAAVVIGREPL